MTVINAVSGTQREGCACPHSDKWYACPIENKKPENVKMMEEYVEWLSKAESEVQE